VRGRSLPQFAMHEGLDVPCCSLEGVGGVQGLELGGLPVVSQVQEEHTPWTATTFGSCDWHGGMGRKDRLADWQTECVMAWAAFLLAVHPDGLTARAVPQCLIVP
jgi:hypothetical protein